jgi:hypothetical protein
MENSFESSSYLNSSPYDQYKNLNKFNLSSHTDKFNNNNNNLKNTNKINNNMDIWNQNINPNQQSNNPVSTFMNNSNDLNNIYKSKFSNVEMDPLAIQMLQLSSTDNSLSQLTTPSLVQNSYFTNKSNVNYNRQLKENNFNNNIDNTSNNFNKNNISNNSNTTTTANFNTNNNNNTTTTTNNNNNNNNPNNAINNSNNAHHINSLNNNWSNNNSYNNYLLQQQQQQSQSNITTSNQFLNQYYKNPKQTQNSISNQTQTRTQTQPFMSSQSQLQSQPQSLFLKNSNLDNNNIYNNNNNNYDSRILKQSESKSTDNDVPEIENYKTKLQLKDIIISKLESELEKMKDFQNTILKTQNDSNGNFEIPKNYEDLYHKLVEKIQSTEAELNDTKIRLESLVTAISMNPNPSTYKNGRYDEEEISHKIISKLKMLTEENDELSRMVSYGKSKEKDIEIALLRKQNNDLLEKVIKLETKLNDKK